MAEFVNDTFSGEASNVALTAHTGETGATWVVISTLDTANVSSSNGNVYNPGSTSVGNYASGTPVSAEYDVEADLEYSAITITAAGVVGRCQTDSQTLYMWRYSAGSTAWQLYKAVSGSFTLLGSYNQTISVSTPYAAKLEIRDATKKGYVDGVERVSSSNNDITSAGRAGLRIVGEGTYGRIDNFTATDASSGTSLLPKELILKFDIHNAVSKNFIGKFDVLNSLSKTNTFKFDVKNTVSQELIGKFDVRNLIGKELIAKFDILSGAISVSKELVAKFDINNSVSKELIAKYDIHNLLTKETIAKFDIKNSVSNELTAKFDIRNITSKELIAVYDMGGTVSKELICVFNIENQGKGGMLIIGGKEPSIKFNNGVLRIG